MTTMINCSIDWTLDLAWEDAKKVTALPAMKDKWGWEGTELFQCLKTDARIFKEEWISENDGKLYANHQYVGDAWLEHLDWDWISDWYKDAYGQRPHFHKVFFAVMCGLPTKSDTALFFCNPIENYLEDAKWNREHF